MEPTSLVAALQRTSRDRVSELREEYRFVGRLENLRGETMLMSRTQVVARLSRSSETEDDGFGADGESVFRELRRIGVLEIRDHGRVDVPDIYRYGYGIKRRGGARAPK
jgi:hypothetical protein